MHTIRGTSGDHSVPGGLPSGDGRSDGHAPDQELAAYERANATLPPRDRTIEGPQWHKFDEDTLAARRAGGRIVWRARVGNWRGRTRDSYLDAIHDARKRVEDHGQPRRIGKPRTTRAGIGHVDETVYRAVDLLGWDERTRREYMSADIIADPIFDVGMELSSVLGRHLTLAEVGALYGLTRERIRQIEVQALAKLRGAGRMKGYQ